MLLFAVGVALLASCDSSRSYSELVKEELSTGIKNDSIFFDMYFGDSRKEFYEKCWELNKDGILYHGASNQTVKYSISAPNDSVSDITMRFYPDFNLSEDIRRMDVNFEFSGWALWNEHLFASELVPYVTEILQEWYGGNAFFIFSNDKGENALIKVDGNREIKISYSGNHYVNVTIEDKSYTLNE